MAAGRRDLEGPRLKPVIPLGDGAYQLQEWEGTDKVEPVLGRSSAWHASRMPEGIRVPAGRWNRAGAPEACGCRKPE